jgi:hypothetical protein
MAQFSLGDEVSGFLIQGESGPEEYSVITIKVWDKSSSLYGFKGENSGLFMNDWANARNVFSRFESLEINEVELKFGINTFVKLCMRSNGDVDIKVCVSGGDGSMECKVFAEFMIYGEDRIKTLQRLKNVFW